jgi:hypothetical protein
MRARERKPYYRSFPIFRGAYNSTTGGWPVDGSGYFTVSSPNNVNVSHSIMLDVDTKAKFHMNDCSHIQRFSQTALTNDTMGTVSNVIDFVDGGDATHCFYGYPVRQIIENSPGYHSVHPFSLSLLEKAFWDTRLPRDITINRDPFDSGFSIWYLVVDIKDLVEIYKKIFKPNDLSKRYRRSDRLSRLRQAITGHEDMTASQLHNANLFVQFGLLPTVSDFEDFFRILNTWKKHYDDAKELFRKKHLYHLPVIDAPQLNLFSRTHTGIVGHALGTDFPLTAEVQTSVGARFHRTLQYQYTAPEFIGWMSRIAQFIDSFGILDPAAIWDVVPFSFVVDWFINIGPWLHNNRPRLFGADTKILDYCESVKRVDTVTWRMDWNAPFGGPPSGPSSTAYVNEQVLVETYTNYVRRKLTPSVSDFTSASLPRYTKRFVNLRRISIASSLVAQRIPR